MTKIKTARTAEGEKFYYLGHTQAVVDDNGNNIEDLLAEQEEKIELLNDNTGVSDYPEFSTSKTYKTGTIVRHEGALFKFTSDHEPGIWDLEEVKSWSINAESQEKLSELGSKKPIFNLSVLYPTEGYNADGTPGGAYYTLKQAMLTIASHINDNLIDGRPAFRESIVLFRAFDEVNNVVFDETAAFLLTNVWGADQAKNVFNYTLLNPFYKKIWITDTTGVDAAGYSPLDSGVWDILFNEDYLEKGDYYIRTNILSDVPTGLVINAPVVSGSGRQNYTITLNQNNFYQTSKISIGEGRVRYLVKEGNANILNNINFRLESVAEHEDRISYIQNLFDKKTDKITVVDYIENDLNTSENFTNVSLSANRNFHYIQARAKENFSLEKSLPGSISSIVFYKEGGSRITLDTPVSINKGDMFYINSIPASNGVKVPVEDFINSIVIGNAKITSPKYLFSNVEVGDDGELLKKKMIGQSFVNSWYISDFIEVIDKNSQITLTNSPAQYPTVIFLYGYDANKRFVVKSDLGGEFNYAHLDNGSHNIAYVRIYWKNSNNSIPSSIESISKTFTVENLAAESLPKILTKFYNKKVYAIGDSITEGYGEGYSWVRKFAELSSALRSHSKAITSHAYNTSIAEASIINDGQLVDIPADSDFILILLGINDYGMRACPLGEKNSSDTTTFYGALNYVYNYLLTNHSDKEIIVFSPILNRSRDVVNSYGLKPRDYSNAIIEKCIEYGLKYVDGWCSELNSNNQANAEIYYKYKKFDSSDPDEDIIDGTHLGIAGEERLAQFIFNNGAY